MIVEVKVVFQALAFEAETRTTQLQKRRAIYRKAYEDQIGVRIDQPISKDQFNLSLTKTIFGAEPRVVRTWYNILEIMF